LLEIFRRGQTRIIGMQVRLQSQSALIVNFAPLNSSQGFTLIESERQGAIPLASSLSLLNLRVVTNTLDGVTTFRTRINGADGNLLITVPALTVGIFQDPVNLDVLALNDLVNFEIDTNAAAVGSITLNSYGWILIPR